MPVGDVLREILDWSVKQPAWQRDALRRLFETGTLAASDLNELLELCKTQHGLAFAGAPVPLAVEHIAISDTGGGVVTLERVTHHHGVNALAVEQTIALGTQLTIIFGDNAAGKSGYTRILKRACRSRSAENVLGNVLSGGPPLKAEATIAFRVGDVSDSIKWTSQDTPSGSLAAISVFDGHCAPIYLRDKTDVAFRPFSLDVFDKLSAACDELRKRLEAERSVLNKDNPVFPKMPDGTAVALLLQKLTALTTPESVQALATLSPEEQTLLSQLRQQRQDSQASDPLKRARDLELKAGRLDAAATHLTTLTRVLDESGVKTLQEAAARVKTTSSALDAIRKSVMTSDVLPGTGSDEWRDLWSAASEYSHTAYHGMPFPVLSEGAKCVLCQQQIGDEAKARFHRFHELVTSTAQADLDSAKAAHEIVLTEVRGLVVEPPELELALAELAVDAPTAEAEIRTFISTAVRVQDLLLKAEASAPPSVSVSGSPEDTVRRLSADLRARSTILRSEQAAMDPASAATLKELEARTALAECIHQVLKEIERKKRLGAYGQAIEDVGTAAITRKSTELTTRLVTDQLREVFQDELEKVQFDHLAIEIRAAGGAKGAMRHQLVFPSAPMVPVASVLSEGESRTLALAAFMTELSTAPAPSAIIFDDPVSSLDHVWRKRIAGRLADEALSRQVIVFTHDILFLLMLIKQAEERGVILTHQHVRRGSAGPGVALPELPWLAMPVKERIGRLRVLWQDVEKISRTAEPDEYERAGRSLYTAIRETWERAIEEVLLNDVIARYKPEIETQKLRFLDDISKDDLDAVKKGMTESSRWSGHDTPAADGTPFPTPKELKDRIDELEAWVKSVRARRK